MKTSSAAMNCYVFALRWQRPTEEDSSSLEGGHSVYMTWDTLTGLLTKLGGHSGIIVCSMGGAGSDTFGLHLPPVAWFIAVKLTGSLNVGVYEGRNHRMVGTEQVPLANLTAEFVHGRIKKAARELVNHSLKPAALTRFLATIRNE